MNETSTEIPVKIGYYDPFTIYPKIQEELSNRLPLTNIHWKYSNQPLKSVPYLPVDIVEEIPRTLANSPVSPENDLSNVPYVRMMFVTCDSIEDYRAKVRPFIREWLKNSIQNQYLQLEWILVYYVPDSAKDSSSAFRTSIFDKMKSDFNTTDGSSMKVERCIKLKDKYVTNVLKIEAYNELITKIKEYLLTSFNSKFTTIENNIATLDKTKDSGKYNQYFLMKMFLAQTFKEMRLYEDALTKYDEIESELKTSVDIYPLGFEESQDFSNYKFEKSPPINEIRNRLLNSSATSFDLRLFIFAKQSYLLQCLSKLASSRSISALYVSELLRRLSGFINDISNSLKIDKRNEYLMAEWAYCVLDSFLSLPLVDMLDEEGERIKEIAEFKGEIQLLKRSQLVTLGKLHSYIINGIMTNISLDDSDKNGLTDSSHSVSFPPLVKLLESETSFGTEFKSITSSVIQDFILANRPRSVDILCTDIALLDYQYGRYKEATEILVNCTTFYTDQGWSFIGTSLLEIYIDCLEKLGSSDDKAFLTAYLELFSSIGGSDDKSNVTTKSKDNLTALFSKISKISKSIDHIFQYPIDRIFDFSVFPYVSAIDEPNSDEYVIEITLKNHYAIDLQFDSLQLEIANDANHQLQFQLSDVSVKTGDNRLKLASTKLYCGDYHLKSFTAYIGNISISRSFSDDLTINNEKIRAYPSIDKLWCEFTNPSIMDLGTKSLVLKIHSDETRENLSLKLNAITKGLDIEYDAITVSSEKEEITTSMESDDEDMILKLLGPFKGTIEIYIPYSLATTGNDIEMSALLCYERLGKSYEHLHPSQLDTFLPIAVSVQDIFKTANLFSKFSVGTSDAHNPIRILDTDLTTDSNFKVLSPSKCSSLITFGEQPASYFFKIEPYVGYEIKETDTLDLAITYRTLKDEYSSLIISRFQEILQKENLKKYTLLLQPILTTVEVNPNRYALSEVVEVANFDISKYTETFSHILPSDRRKVMKLLKDFMAQRPIIQQKGLSNQPELISTNRILNISVSVPLVQVIQVIELKFEKKSQYVVGEPIAMKLQIQAITKWRGKSSSKHKKEVPESSDELPKQKKKVLFETNSSEIEAFILELQCVDNWLVSGKKRINFSVDSNSPDRDNILEQFDIVLIPLKVGKLTLPKVDVRSIKSHLNDEYVMEVDYKNESQSLLVVPELDKVSFAF